MLTCWAAEASDRPAFDELIEKLSSILDKDYEDLDKHDYVELLPE